MIFLTIIFITITVAQFILMNYGIYLNRSIIVARTTAFHKNGTHDDMIVYEKTRTAYYWKVELPSILLYYVKGLIMTIFIVTLNFGLILFQITYLILVNTYRRYLHRYFNLNMTNEDLDGGE